jgi:hypothetical protein
MKTYKVVNKCILAGRINEKARKEMNSGCRINNWRGVVIFDENINKFSPVTIKPLKPKLI